MATFRIRPGLRKSDPKPNSSRSLAVRRGARRRGRRTTIQLLLEQKILRDHRSHATGATPRRGHDGPVKQGEQKGFHARDSVGQTSGATQRGLNLGFSERIGNSRHTRCTRGAATTKPRLPWRTNSADSFGRFGTRMCPAHCRTRRNPSYTSTRDAERVTLTWPFDPTDTASGRSQPWRSTPAPRLARGARLSMLARRQRPSTDRPDIRPQPTRRTDRHDPLA